MASVDSRSRIINTAIEMFNEKGVSVTTPAQIAAKLGMRPSNFYYYFENKEHLLRVIWQEVMIPALTPLFYDEEACLSESGIIKFFSLLSERVTEYRFFYLELYSILTSDPLILETYTKRHRELMDRALVCMESWINLGIMRDIPPDERRVLAENMWIAGQSHMTFVKLTGPEISPSELASHAAVYAFSILRPNLTESASIRIQRLSKLNGGNGIRVIPPAPGAGTLAVNAD